MPEKTKVATGDIEIRNKKYVFELWIDNGKDTEFMRNSQNSLQSDIEAVLITNGIIGEGK